MDRLLRCVVITGILSGTAAFSQIPKERTRGVEPAQDVIIQTRDEPLVIPAGIVGWIAASVGGTVLGLGGIIYKRHTDDISELKSYDIALGLKVDRHFEIMMDAIRKTK